MKREMGTDRNELEVIKRLEQIRAVSPRDPQETTLGRAKFLQQAQALQATVSQRRKVRHIGWMNFMFLPKERTRMTTLITILLIVSLALGGGGVTVAAAQASQPDEPLYGLKLASENAQFGLTTQEESRLELALRFADRRAEELSGMVKEGVEVPAQVAARWEQQVRTAMQIAAGMDDEAMKGALVQVQTRLQAQERLMNQAEEVKPGDPIMQQVRTQLQLRTQQLEQGLGDPQAFRNMVQTKQSTGSGEGTWADCDPDPYCGYGPGPGPGGEENPGGPEEPGNPWVSDDEYPGPGYGPGPGEGEPSEGENGIQDGNSDGNSANGDQQQQGGNGNGQNGGGNGDGSGGSGGNK